MSSHQVIFRGGLGNQLFCLFHSYKIAISQKNKVYINLTNYFFYHKGKEIIFS